MKPTLLCVFAHPDDEAFGPSGTIALYAKTHTVYLICVTNGDDITNTEFARGTLPAIRQRELRESAEMLGVTDVFFLPYLDGMISNNMYHTIAADISAIVDRLKPAILLTFEPRGVSGHIDHMALSMITSFVFTRSQSAHTLMYYCIDDRRREEFSNYFIYFPPGYPRSQIDLVIDVTSVWAQKMAAVQKHQSQKKDIARIVPVLEKLPKEEYFLILKK